MKSRSGRFGVAVLAMSVVAAAMWILLHWPTEQIPEAQAAVLPAVRPPAEPLGVPRWLGMGSCASCHNANGAPGAVRSEFSTWQALDPHSRSYAVLLEPRSRNMVQSAFGLAAAPPEKQPLCLACHQDAGAAAVSVGPRFSSGQGVGCQSCHGPAEHYREPHARSEWRERPVEEKIALGMQPLWAVGVRVKLCIRCHVGSGDFRVDHGLLAVGHPPLFFEAVSHLSRMPRHWQNDRDAKGEPIRQDALWAAGQIETARAVFLRIAEQAEALESPWPAFAEMECSSCHHDLGGPHWRRPQGKAHRAGPFRPQQWHTATLGDLLAVQPMDVTHAWQFDFNRLEQELSRGSPDRKRVSDLASKLAAMLPLRVEVPNDPSNLIARLMQVDQDHTPTWSSATQRYLALTTLINTLPKAKDASRRELEACMVLFRNALGNHRFDGQWDCYRGMRTFNPDLAYKILNDTARLTLP